MFLLLPFSILCIGKSLSLGAWNYPTFLSRRFHRPIYVKYEFISNSDPHGNLGNQLQSGARTNVDVSKWCRQFHVRLHCFILTEACSCRLELADFAGKISKNRLVCKNAVALAYYGSCRLLVMGSWHWKKSILNRKNVFHYNLVKQQMTKEVSGLSRFLYWEVWKRKSGQSSEWI